MAKLCAVLFLIIVISCGGDGNSNVNNDPEIAEPGNLSYEPKSCDIVGQNEFIHTLMKDIYYWYDQTPELDYESYDAVEDLLADMRYDVYDRWSYISDADAYADYKEGRFIGFGFALYNLGEDNVRFKYVFDDSPCGRAGITRGDKLIALEGIPIRDILAQDIWSQLTGPDEIGVTVEFTIEKTDGTIEDISLTKDLVNINTVLHNSVLEVDGRKVGYLVYYKFLKSLTTELKDALNYLESSQIDELIIDLRYNSGGSVDVATYLATAITGEKVTAEDTFLKIRHNDRYADWNFDIPFYQIAGKLNVDRVLIISTQTTCSASESVINGLAPYMEVVLIGESATCGKPCGMYSHAFCDKVVVPIELSIENVNGVGEYFNGIEPDCYAQDTMDAPFGDRMDPLLSAALDYIAMGACDHMGLLENLRDAGPQIQVELKGLRREIGAF